jgi:hypothetical protein
LSIERKARLCQHEHPLKAARSSSLMSGTDLANLIAVAATD